MKPHLSFSGAQLLHKCPRKFFLNSTLRKPFFAAAMAQGSGYHTLQELTYTVPLDEVRQRYQSWCEEVVNRSRQFISEEDMESLLLAHHKAKALFQAHMTLVAKGLLKPVTLEVLHSEHRFFIELERSTLRGVIDQIVLIENTYPELFPDRDKLLAVVDFKTTSLELETYWGMLVRSHQGPIYLHWAQSEAFKQLFPELHAQYGYPVGMLFDMIRTPAIRQKKSETLPEFLQRYEEDVYDKYPSTAERRLFVPTDENIADSVRAYDYDARIYEMYRTAQHWPKGGDCLRNADLCEYRLECDCVTNGSTDLPSKKNLVQIGDTNGIDDSEHEEL